MKRSPFEIELNSLLGLIQENSPQLRAKQSLVDSRAVGINRARNDYLPDFIVRLDNGVHLILETKGYDPLDEVKAAAAYRWVDAVNADGSFGEWRYAVVRDPSSVGETLAGV